MTKEELDELFENVWNARKRFNDYIDKFFETRRNGEIVEKAEKTLTREEWKKIKKMEWERDELWKKFVKAWEEINL